MMNDEMYQLDQARADLTRTQEQSDAVRDAAIRAANYRRNLAEVVQSPAGYDVVFQMLASLGVGQECAEDVRLIALRNFGERLCTDIFTAAPREALQLMAALRSRNQ